MIKSCYFEAFTWFLRVFFGGTDATRAPAVSASGVAPDGESSLVLDAIVEGPDPTTFETRTAPPASRRLLSGGETPDGEARRTGRVHAVSGFQRSCRTRV